MEKATVTVESEGEKTTVDVIVTDEKDYEIVDLRVGDTKTYTDKTGNYSDSTLDGLDKNIADVTLVGEDAQAVEKQVKGTALELHRRILMERKSPWITACLHLRVWQIKKIHIKFPHRLEIRKYM